jgi:hypothetical protein
MDVDFGLGEKEFDAARARGVRVSDGVVVAFFVVAHGVEAAGRRRGTTRVGDGGKR